MFKRKIETEIIKYFNSSKEEPILVVDGARQIGKTFIIKYLGKKYFKNFIYINFVHDNAKEKKFKNIGSITEFYFTLGAYEGAKNKLNNKEPVLIFLDEIQEYPQYLTLLKFFKEDKKYKFICSGSLFGITLKKTTSIPIGSMQILHMYQLDFEEFLLANNINEEFILKVKDYFLNNKSLPESIHSSLLTLFKKYLLIGGLPEAVKAFVNTNNIQEVRKIHDQIYSFYADDASKYDHEHKLKIKKVYDLIPSSLENIKKRIVVKDIEDNDWACFETYLDEFDYLIGSGIAINVQAISNPCFPLIKSTKRNLVKFYLNDVGILSNIYFKTSIQPVMEDIKSFNLGALYECVVANELKAHGFNLYYYNNKQKGEVDFLIDDYNSLSAIPVEVKSGKDYYTHSALDNLISCKDYDIKQAYVFSNDKDVKIEGKIIYMPIYYCMFLNIYNVEAKNQAFKYDNIVSILNQWK